MENLSKNRSRLAVKEIIEILSGLDISSIAGFRSSVTGESVTVLLKDKPSLRDDLVLKAIADNVKKLRRPNILIERIEAGYFNLVSEFLKKSVSDALFGVEVEIQTAWGNPAKPIVFAGVPRVIREISRESEIEEKALLALENTLCALGFPHAEFIVNFKEGTFSGLDVLRIIHHYSPISMYEISKVLEHRLDYSINIADVEQELASLRRRHYITWEENRGFIMTLLGLSNVPTIKGKDSTDNKRILLLSKRKW